MKPTATMSQSTNLPGSLNPAAETWAEQYAEAVDRGEKGAVEAIRRGIALRRAREEQERQKQDPQKA